ncbi:tetratricopeptide repeat protein [Myroides profundi]|uniref:Tetratricopeptide repeat-containing protein n=1 Tax=Myroides profundi TaxID=480520 RepID=A0AAJ4W4G6_MYRPR|nr:hypothetical protein [Myroides profundi]AJH14521.1 hypothetical protein MPR_1339 [Myroides profundi]SEQ93953.1 Tetratricopeptide repeat-containing protein [Myroides profundi]
MSIEFKLDQYFYLLFPSFSKDQTTLIKEVEQYYTINGLKPIVELTGDLIKIHIDSNKLKEIEQAEKKLVILSEKGEYIKAISFAESLIEKQLISSEIYRIYGQLLSESGDNSKAIDVLIESLRLDPKNKWALLMMGNIQFSYLKDIDTAKTYYNEVLRLDNKDYITLSNLGSILCQKNLEEGVEYLYKALDIEPNYPNANLSLAIYYFNVNNNKQAFNYALKAWEYANENRDILKSSSDLAQRAANKISKQISIKDLDRYIQELEKRAKKPIKIEIDESLQVTAKIEIAENYNRDFHLVKYKESHGSGIHLVLHELIHLDFILQAREVNANLLFTTSNDKEELFIKKYQDDFHELLAKGYPESALGEISKMAFDGTNLLVYNTPIDLFIEDKIYSEFKDFRASQFLSLVNIITDGIESVTNQRVLDLFPANIIQITKVLNLVHGLLFKDLYKIDLIKAFKATKQELDQAKDFYNEFIEYRSDREPAEEYELVQNWADDLKISQYFELKPDPNNKINKVKDNDTQNQLSKMTIDELLAELEQDPYSLNEDKSWQDKAQALFNQTHTSDSINLAVTMFMVDALNYYKALDLFKVKQLAIDWATLGMAGIDPQKDGYSLPAIPNKIFSGYKVLAYYYVSWAIALPEMLDQLGMPFKKEYELAQSL